MIRRDGHEPASDGGGRARGRDPRPDDVAGAQPGK
jgi:hypothetical protein